MAFSLSNDVRVALLVIFGELEGAKFDWAKGQFKERK